MLRLFEHLFLETSLFPYLASIQTRTVLNLGERWTSSMHRSGVELLSMVIKRRFGETFSLQSGCGSYCEFHISSIQSAFGSLQQNGKPEPPIFVSFSNPSTVNELDLHDMTRTFGPKILLPAGHPQYFPTPRNFHSASRVVSHSEFQQSCTVTTF